MSGEARRYTIVISEAAAAKCERGAEEADWTPEQFMAWVVEEYQPPDGVWDGYEPGDQL